MWLQKTVNVLARGIEPITRWTHNIGSGVLAVMMFLTATDVTGRYGFNSPIPGSYELQEFLMVTMIAMGVGYCAFLKGHINVDILFNKLPQRVQSGFNVFHYLVAACLFAMVSWRTLQEGLLMQSRNMTSTVLYIPVLPFYCIAALGSAVLCIAFLYNSIESLSKVLVKWNQ